MTTQRLTLSFPINFNLSPAKSLTKKISLSLFLTSAIIAVLLLLVLYLFQIERLTREGYLIKTYNQEIKLLKEENLTLEQEYSRTFSLPEAEKKMGSLDFVEVSKIKYIPISFDYLVRQTR